MSDLDFRADERKPESSFEERMALLGRRFRSGEVSHDQAWLITMLGGVEGDYVHTELFGSKRPPFRIDQPTKANILSWIQDIHEILKESDELSEAFKWEFSLRVLMALAGLQIDLIALGEGGHFSVSRAFLTTLEERFLNPENRDMEAVQVALDFITTRENTFLNRPIDPEGPWLDPQVHNRSLLAVNRFLRLLVQQFEAFEAFQEGHGAAQSSSPDFLPLEALDEILLSPSDVFNPYRMGHFFVKAQNQVYQEVTPWLMGEEAPMDARIAQGKLVDKEGSEDETTDLTEEMRAVRKKFLGDFEEA